MGCASCGKHGLLLSGGEKPSFDRGFPCDDHFELRVWSVDRADPEQSGNGSGGHSDSGAASDL